jgi:hypothetical protein
MGKVLHSWKVQRLIPLLRDVAELGINIPQIMRRTITVLNPFRVNPDLHEDADLSGPIIFCVLFGVCQLLAGKLHFGVILGWTTLASLFLYMVFNLLAGKNGSLDLYRCVSLVGYCLIPMVLFSALSIFVPGRCRKNFLPAFSYLIMLLYTEMPEHNSI